MNVERLHRCLGFEWDEGNADKNWIKHRVSCSECEQIFFNRPLVVTNNAKHSQEEPRYYALGRTDTGRQLFAAFTIRGDLIRVISARDMSRRERRIYDRAQKETDSRV